MCSCVAIAGMAWDSPRARFFEKIGWILFYKPGKYSMLRVRSCIQVIGSHVSESEKIAKFNLLLRQVFMHEK